ncbi:high affinity copper uptake protein 1 isoform X1 [Vespula maculifrons]|uniref:Copper transport protein n=1 Tax=Vespula maculifrons TaxID=7453 RepID=A0ABD2BXN1_VESMC
MNFSHAAHMSHENMDHGSMSHAGMDHANMDHANMNHAGMDHMASGHMHSSAAATGGCSNMGMHGMSMAFHGGYCETVLFESWKITSIGSLIGSMIGIIIMATLYEGLKYYREYLFWKTYSSLQYRSVTMPQEKNVVAEDNRVVHMVGEAHNAVMDALFPNVPAYHTSHPFLLFNADLHDIQHLALFRSSFWCYPWLLPFRMEEICNRGCYRTLSLVIDIVA